MRILHLVYASRWTGAAAVTIDQVLALRDAGVEAQVGFIKTGALAERFAEEGWARPLLTKARLPGHFLADAQGIRETVRRERFDLVHCHHPHDHALAVCALASARLPTPGYRLLELGSRKQEAGSRVVIVRTIHQDRHVRRDPLTRAVFGKTNGLAFSNASIEHRFREAFGSGRSLAVLPPVVDPERFCPGPRDASLAVSFGLPPGRFVVVTIGKLAKGRGFDVAIEALARTTKNEIVLLHIGKGEDRERLETLAERLGVADRNFWAGYQEELLPAVYRLGDAFLFMASGSDEGHRAILEAMAAGLPVVALDRAGVRELVAEGTGLIAPSVNQIAPLLDELARDRDLAKRLAAGARQEAAAFSPRRFVERVAPFYKAVLD